jgi:disulfide bond formation protein DsbB
MFALRQDRPAAITAGIVALAAAALIAGAWAFQIVGDMAPCPLCLQQRWPHYLAIPLGAGVAFAAWRGAPACVITGGLTLLAVLMLGSTGMGVYHAGVEWAWWPGPTDCAVAQPTTARAGDLLAQMRRTTVVRCDEAPWRWVLSLAGWNAVLSALLCAMALMALGGRALVPRFSGA